MGAVGRAGTGEQPVAARYPERRYAVARSAGAARRRPGAKRGRTGEEGARAGKEHMKKSVAKKSAAPLLNSGGGSGNGSADNGNVARHRPAPARPRGSMIAAIDIGTTKTCCFIARVEDQ